MAGDSFEEHWPRYPSDGSGHKLMDLIAECDVDKLFKLQWDSSSDFLAKSQQVRGNKDFVATPWVGSADEVEAAAKTANSATPDQTLEATEYEGKVRKTTCNSFGMGMKFQTFEVQRCIEAKVGKEYTMNTCVMTTATYGEKFRPVFKYTLKAEGEKQCRCQVEYQLVYVTSVNAFIKKAIERGASNGITKNFETVQDVLKDFVTIRDASKAPAAKPSAPAKKGEPSDATAKGPPQPTGPRQPWWTGVMDRSFVKSFEPLATWTKSLVNAGGTPPPQDGVSLTATGMALTLMIFSIFCLRGILHGVHAWLLSFTGISGWVFRTTTGWMDIPDSLCEVVVSFWLLVATHTALGHLATFASDVLSSPDQPTASAARVADSDAPDGTRYDGYDDSYNNASSSLGEEVSSPNGSSKGLQVGSHVIGTHRHRDVWNQQIKESNEKAKTQIKQGFKEFRRMMGGMGHQEEKKEEKKEAKSRRRLRRHSRTGSDVSVDSLDLEPSASSISSAVAAPSGKALASDTVVRAPAPAPSNDQATGAPQPPSTAAAPPVAVAGSNGAATGKAVPGVSSPKAIRTQQSPGSGTVTSVMTPLLEKTDHMLASWGAQLGLSRGAAALGKSGDSPVASQSEAPARGDKPELEANNSVTSAVVPILEKTDEYLASWGVTRSVSNAKSEGEGVLQHGSPPIIYSAGNAASPAIEDESNREPLQINAARHKTYSESELAEMETGPVQEEVFENERFQPFKGWGHNWPGHFLPTDKIGHWSNRDGTPGKAASMAFSTVAPKLPKGWSWIEEGWVVDTQGIADDAVDVEGWSYATDFGWHMPPAAGAGKFRRVRDYVRRRRWIRSRVRKPSEQQPGTAISSAANSPMFVASSSSSGPIFNRPSNLYATHDDPTAGNASFSSQRSGYAGAIAPSGGSQPYLGNLHENSPHSLGRIQSSKALGQEDRPYMNLSEVRQGLSAECNKWGSSVVSELHKAISSTGDDMGSVARDSMHSDDYVGNSPMSAGLQRLSGPTAFHSSSGPPAAAFPSANSNSTLPSGAAGSGQPFAARPSPQFVTVSTPQTMGTAGGLPVAPELANATGHAHLPAVSGSPASHDAAVMLSGNVPPRQIPAPCVENRTIGGVPVQNTAAEEFPAQEELTVEGSAGSAPSSMFGQIKHGRLGMHNPEPVESLCASAVADAFPGPSQGPGLVHSTDSPVGHQHAYDKEGVVLARPADS